MQKSYRLNQNGNRNYLMKNRQNNKVKDAVSNDKNSPYMYNMYHPQKTIKGHGKLKSSSGFIGLNTLISPTHSVFEKKIRQAIQMRYKKSKITDYKYVKIQDHKHQKNSQDIGSSSESRQSSQGSEQMEQMKHIAYLKNVSFVNIHHFHSQKCAPLKQTSIEKERNTKRRFKVPLSSGNLNQCQKQLQSNKDQDEPKNQKVNKQSNPNIVNLVNKKLQQSQTFNCKDDLQINSVSQQKQKKFLTSRLPYQRQPINLQNIQFQNLSTLSPTGQYASQNKIKDTFKLKYPHKILNKNIQKNENEQRLTKQQQKSQRSSEKATTKARRFILQKNQKLQKIKTQPDQLSQLSYRFQNVNNDSSYQKIASLRKIQTQFIEPISNQQQIHNKTTKNKAKMIKNFRNNNFLINRINQHSQKSFHSTSQQKWKLQEISFKFKPVNEAQKTSRNHQMQKMQQNKNHALKLGLSLQKAYSKILENKKKMEKKEEPSARTNYVSQQKKKRRMLRVSPKNEQSLIINGQRELKLIKKDQSENLYSANLIENRNQESLSGERGQSTRYNFLKNQKKERFSTIQ